jgi:hypothetical protein
MQKLMFAVLAGTVLLACGVLSHAQQNKNAENKKADDNQAMIAQLKLDRVATARKCSEAYQAGYDAGTVTLEAVLAVYEKRRDAELAVADTDAAKLKALQAHLGRVKQIDKKIQDLFQRGMKGGEATKAALSELAVQDAEIALLTEMAKKA